MTLTQPEKDFIPCLKAVQPTSIWGISIRAVLKDEIEPADFRNLIKDLKSQADDSPEIMIGILGINCYSQLIKL